MNVERCRFCRSMQLRFDEVLKMFRCMSCWGLHIPKEEPDA